MDLSLERPEGYLYVRRVGARGVTLIDRELTSSFLLAPDRAIENWPVTAAGTLDASHVEAFMAGFLRKGIGIEVMDNAAAARTYNLLAGEGRRVIAGFILPPT